MRTAARIIGGTLRGVVIVAALAAAAILVLPRLLGWQVVTVMSGSMTPTYPVDTVLAIAPVDPADVHEGDVIAFMTEADRPLVTHRVMAVDDTGLSLAFVTKGDANDAADSDPVAASAVRGRVVFGTPHLGSFVRGVNSDLGFIGLFVVPGVVLIGLELRSMRRVSATAKRPVAQQVVPEVAVGVANADEFDFWETDATEDRYYQELDRKVRSWCGSEC